MEARPGRGSDRLVDTLTRLSQSVIMSSGAPWTPDEQQLLQQALRTYPASLPKQERWHSIAVAVPGHSAKECIAQCQALAAAVRAASGTDNGEAKVKVASAAAVEDAAARRAPQVAATAAAAAEAKAEQAAAKKQKAAVKKAAAAEVEQQTPTETGGGDFASVGGLPGGRGKGSGGGKGKGSKGRGASRGAGRGKGAAPADARPPAEGTPAGKGKGKGGKASGKSAADAPPAEASSDATAAQSLVDAQSAAVASLDSTPAAPPPSDGKAAGKGKGGKAKKGAVAPPPATAAADAESVVAAASEAAVAAAAPPPAAAKVKKGGAGKGDSSGGKGSGRGGGGGGGKGSSGGGKGSGAGGAGKWWARDLAGEVDPISLEPLRSLKYPPFGTSLCTLAAAARIPPSPAHLLCSSPALICFAHTSVRDTPARRVQGRPHTCARHRLGLVRWRHPRRLPRQHGRLPPPDFAARARARGLRGARRMCAAASNRSLHC